jgi:hypothetical protein
MEVDGHVRLDEREKQTTNSLFFCQDPNHLLIQLIILLLSAMMKMISKDCSVIQVIVRRIILHSSQCPSPLSRLCQPTTSIFQMSTIHMQSLPSVRCHASRIGMSMSLKLVTSNVTNNCYILLHVFFSSLLIVTHFLLSLYLLNMQENTSCQTHVQHVFASR